MREIHRSPVNSPDKGQWRGALMFSLVYDWKNGSANHRHAGDLRRHLAHYDVTVMKEDCPNAFTSLNKKTKTNFRQLMARLSIMSLSWRSYTVTVWLILTKMWSRVNNRFTSVFNMTIMNANKWSSLSVFERKWKTHLFIPYVAKKCNPCYVCHCHQNKSTQSRNDKPIRDKQLLKKTIASS